MTNTSNSDPEQGKEKSEDDSYLALVSKSYQNMLTGFHQWTESLLDEEKTCISSATFHRTASAVFIVVTMGATAYFAYLTIVNILAQGALSRYNGLGVGLLGRSNAQFMTKAFASTSEREHMAYILSIWFNNMLVVSFSLWVFAIVRSTNVKAVAQEFKVVTYFSIIPLAVACQWAANTSALYMYLGYSSDGAVSQSTTTLRYIFQIAAWVVQGLCIVAILVSIVGQMKYCYHKRQEIW